MKLIAKAAILEKTGHPLTIKEIEVPPLQKGQVLVKIFFSGVCRSQLMEVRGGRGVDPWLPHLLGHEASGVVIGTGEGVTKVSPGDEVILGWIRGEGLEADGAKYLLKEQVINSGRVSTFSNYSIVSENRIVKKPSDLPMDIAVLFGCALPTGAGMVLNELKPSPMSTVVVVGLGGIGISALMALKALNVSKIIAVDISEEKLKLAKELGATDILNSSHTDFLQSFFEITEGGADFAVESGGQVRTIELAFSLIKKNGKLIFASHPPEGEKISLAPHELISGKTIKGSWGGDTFPDKDLPKFHRVFMESGAPLASLLTKKYTLDRVNEALEDLEKGRVFRPLLVMDHKYE